MNIYVTSKFDMQMFHKIGTKLTKMIQKPKNTVKEDLTIAFLTLINLSACQESIGKAQALCRDNSKYFYFEVSAKDVSNV
ncbi:hypothetical protein GH733_007927, partial [Mirounga leonina]